MGAYHFTYNKKGKVTHTTYNGKTISNKKSSSNHHHSSGSSSSSNNNSELKAKIVNAKTGEVIQKGNFNTSYVPGSNHHHSSGSSSSLNNNSGTGTIIMNNTKTGITTKTNVNLSNGKTISNKSEITQRLRDEKIQRINNITNDYLSEKVKTLTVNQIRNNNQNYQIQQTISRKGKLPKNIDYRKYNVIKPQPKKTYNNSNKSAFGKTFDKDVEKIKDYSHYLKSKAKNINNKNNFGPAEKSLLNIGSMGLSAIVTVKETLIDPIRTPITTTKNMISLTNDLITKPSAREEFSNKVGEFGKKLQSGDPIAAGQVLGTVIAPKVPGVIIDGAAKVTNTIKFVGKTEIPRSEYVHTDVIKGKTIMPSAKGTNEIINAYDKADGKVITFSPQKLGKIDSNTGTPTSNPFKGKQISGDTRKGALGQEDGGINVAPKGVANDYFTRIEPSSTSSQYTLSPKKILESIKMKFQTPTATEFNSKGIVRPPKNVLNEPGFEAVKKWHKEELAGTGKVAITKRSLLGQGELPRKKFKNIRNENKIETERGTTEYELTIPQGQEFIQTGTKSFIRVKGKKVAIRKAEMIITKNDNLSNLAEIKKQKLIKTKQLLKEQKVNDYYSKKNRIEYKSPLNEFRGLSDYSKVSKYDSSSGISSPKVGSSLGSSPGESKLKLSGYGSGSSPGKRNHKGNSSSGSSPGRSNPKLSSSGSGSGGSSVGLSSGGSFSSYKSYFNNKPPISPKTPLLKKSKNNKINSNSGYDIFIREKGKRIKVNKKKLPYNLAIKRGENIVDNTIAGSFEIIKKGKTNIQDIPHQNIGNKFRARKTKNALKVVEKSKNRIDTRGEKQGLNVAKFIRRFNL